MSLIYLSPFSNMSTKPPYRSITYVSKEWEDVIVDKEMIITNKEDAINKVHEIFKGNKNFINHCVVMIASTEDFIGIDSYDVINGSFYWETFLRLTINYSETGFKTLCYRKGNKEMSDTSDIHDCELTIINGSNKEYIQLRV